MNRLLRIAVSVVVTIAMFSCSQAPLDEYGGTIATLRVPIENIIEKRIADADIARNNEELCYRVSKALAAASNYENPTDAIDAFITTYGEGVCEVCGYDYDDTERLANDLRKLADETFKKSLGALRNRANILGAIEPNIYRIADSDKICAELPGVKRGERVNRLLTMRSQLEFWTVCDANETSDIMAILYNEANAIVREYLLQNGASEENTSFTPMTDLLRRDYVGVNQNGEQFDAIVYAPLVGAAEKDDMATISEYLKIDALRNLLPADVKLCWSNKSSMETSRGTFLLYALKGNNGAATPVLDGSGITNARAQGGQYGGFEVSMTMDSDTAIKWGDITAANVGKQIAIVLDDYVYSAPNVNDRIDGGQLSISGNFTPQEAEDLAGALKSNGFPVNVELVNIENVAPKNN